MEYKGFYAILSGTLTETLRKINYTLHSLYCND